MDVLSERQARFRFDTTRLVKQHADALVVGSLWAICLLLCFWTWAQWGNLTIDVGREMYVPAELNRGRVLYRDVMYPYGPLIPYWHALLYRLFGTHLNVLYGTSLVIILAIVTLLFRMAREFLPRGYAFVVGLAFLLQAFQTQSIFSYALPYSFPAVYGSLEVISMAFIAIQAARSSDPRPVIWAGAITAAALLTKQEFGVACLIMLAMLIFIRFLQRRSKAMLAREVLVCVPSLGIAVSVYLWFCSLGGLQLLLKENFMSAPQHYFTKHYGAIWAANSGMHLTPILLITLLLGATAAAIFWTIWIFSLRFLLDRLSVTSEGVRRALVWTICLLTAIGIQAVISGPSNLWYAFPKSMYVFGLISFAITVLGAIRVKLEPAIGRVLVVFFALLLAFRVSTKVSFFGYALYYSPLLYLCVVMLLCHFTERAMAGRPYSTLRTVNSGVVLLLILGLLATAFPMYRFRVAKTDMLTTPRGTIAVYPHDKADPYKETLAFFQSAKANGKTVMVLPEDTALYFLSDLSAPSRFYELTPGVIGPGELTDSYLRDLAHANVDYIVLTNRPSPEYGDKYFGIDYDQPVQRWIDSHYEVIGQIGHFAHHEEEVPWGALIYRRRPRRETS
jgi:hypothetical protein